ncbi:MAG: tetratricopeptide repeat protein, partial [Desulfosalsimonas sp.]
ELLSGNGAETDADAESPESDSKQAMDFEQFQQEYNTIVEIVETGEYGKARKGFKELLNKEVETQNTEELKELRSSIWNNLGAMALEQGDIEEAERALEKATELNPENESAYNNLGALLLRQGHYEEAIEAYEKVLHINPQHIGTINDLATLLIEVRQYSRAGDLLASAIDMDITNERSLKLLARMYAENNVKKDSEKVRAEWLRKAGPKPEDRARVAFQYLAFGQPEHAKAILKLIREENPGWDGLETLEGRILAAENKWKEAIEKLETGLEKNPRDLSVRNDLVTVLLRSGKTEEAVEVAEEGTRKSPDKAVSWYLKGLVYEAKGDIGTAKSAYDQAIEVDPGHTQALLNRAVIVIKEAESNEDAPEAVELLEKALSSDPNNQKVIYNLGRVLVISEIDYKRGIRLLARAGKGRGEAAQKARDFIDRIYEGVKGMEETTTDRPVYKTGLEFDGKKSYVELSAPYTAVPNTFEAWINVPESVPDDQRVGVITGSYPETNNINFEVHQTGNPRIWWNDGEIDVQINEEDVRTGEWLHFAVVRNPADDEFRFYINGEVVESVVGTGEDVVPESPQIIGGDWRLDDGPIFHGRIGELRVWSQPKTEKEIKTLMDAELAGDEEGLLGYWIFDEGEGGIAYDHSRFENHGRIKGATWYEE